MCKHKSQQGRRTRPRSQGWHLCVVASMVLFVLLAACGGQNTPRTSPVVDNTTDTSVAEGDVFEVRVFGEEDLSGNYRVASDGTINFPFVGRLEVSGKQASDIARVIEQRLTDGGYLKQPHVSVFVTDAQSKRVNIVGAVKTPGSLPMTSGMTLVQAISIAGGFTPLGDQSSVVITRIENGERRKYQVSVSKVTRGEAPDFPLMSGDLIYVPERIF